MTDPSTSGSFRDPSGAVFRREGTLCRQVNLSYKDHYDRLMRSGLYDRLTAAGLLIGHEEVDPALAASEGAYKVIRPELVPFVSYPYEWCFGQFKAAALLTLEIQTRAMEAGMTLKDCSAYNVQFLRGRAVLIDTLSFETYREGAPWVAYRQFCQHFLAPLALMSHKDVRLGRLLRVHMDGVPLDLADKLLGVRKRLSLSLYLHVHLHARSQRRYADTPVDARKLKVSRRALRGLLDNLSAAVGRLKWKPTGTEWARYYSLSNYSPEALRHKKTVVAGMLERARPRTVWDVGANVGVFSRLATERRIPTVAFDADCAAVEINYLDAVERGDGRMLPLVMDLTNPSGDIGWANEERMSLARRGPADAVMALALIHHLAIANNVPLERIARFLSSLGRTLIIEFVPKEDSQVQRMLASRADIFPDYHRAGFERAFGRHFAVEASEGIAGSGRVLYLMRNASL